MKDLLILGGGMAGMTAALYASRAQLDFKLITRDSYDFGQIGDAILVENYPCVDFKSGFDLAMGLHNQLESNNVEIEEKEIKNIYHTNETQWTVEYEDGTSEETKSIIYALGARHRELNCKIEDGIPIHYCALCDGNLYQNADVGIIGGGDSAFTQAEYLSKICKDIYIIMCDQNVTAAPTTFNRVSKLHNVHIWYDAPVNSISKDTEGICWIWCKGVRGPLFAEGVFVAIGMIPNTQILTESSFQKKILDKAGYIIADEMGKTELSGFFAAGDVRQKQLRQSITAAADGANAVQSVIQYLKEKSQD